MSTKIGVLIVDESPAWRAALSSALGGVEDLSLLGAAPTGATGLARAAQLAPDVIIISATLDDLPAAEFARGALGQDPDVGVLLAVEATSSAATVDAVIDTLEAGAFDFFSKPEDERSEEVAQTLARRLLPKIRAFSTARYSNRAKRLAGGRPRRPRKTSQHRRADDLMRKRLRAKGLEVVLLAVSTGGPEALKRILPALPARFPLPIVVAIHLPSPFTASLARSLDKSAALGVGEATAGTPLMPGHVYLGRGGEHLLLTRDEQGRLTLVTNTEPPRNGCRPSADLLFESAAKACPVGVIALVMTGMGADGLEGVRRLRGRAECYVLAQDEESSVVWGMPGSVVRADLQDEVLPLSEIAARLVALVER